MSRAGRFGVAAGCVPGRCKTHRFKSKEGTTMRPSITLVFAAAALGTALASAPAFAQPTKQKVLHQPSGSAASPASLSPSAPVSPGGIGASPNSYGGGPGFVGEVHGTASNVHGIFRHGLERRAGFAWRHWRIAQQLQWRPGLQRRRQRQRKFGCRQARGLFRLVRRHQHVAQQRRSGLSAIRQRARFAIEPNRALHSLSAIATGGRKNKAA